MTETRVTRRRLLLAAGGLGVTGVAGCSGDGGDGGGGDDGDLELVDESELSTRTSGDGNGNATDGTDGGGTAGGETDGNTTTGPGSDDENATVDADSDDGDQSPGVTGWPRFGFDAANTGFNPAASAPGVAPEAAWRLDLETLPFTLAVADGTVYAPAGGTLHAVDAASGERRWRVSPDSLPDNSRLGPPAAAGDRVYFGSWAGGSDDRIYAVDTADGEVVWSDTTGRSVEGPPVVADGVVYASGRNALLAYRAEDGEPLWETGGRYTFDGVAWGAGQSPAPAVAGGRVYVGASHSQQAVFAVPALSPDETRAPLDPKTSFHEAEEGDLSGYEWVFGRGEGRAGNGTPVVADGTVYAGGVDGGTLYALGAEAGAVQWSQSVGRSAAGAAVAVADGTVYAPGLRVDDSGEETTVSATLAALAAGSGEPRWTRTLFETPESVGLGPAHWSPLVAGDAVVLRDIPRPVDGEPTFGLHAFDRGDGTPRWSRTAEFFGNPAVADGRVVVGTGALAEDEYAIEQPRLVAYE